MRIGKKEFQVPGHTYVMGILNVTPDSFSDGGKFNDPDQALFRVEQMIAEGVDLIDLGGESTKPGTDYGALTPGEETERVVPVIEKIRERFDIPLSLDTYHSETAKAGIAAGVDMINDVWGLKFDPQMAKVIAEAGVACCLMHNRKEAVYDNFINDVTSDLAECIRLAEEAGIADNKIILDAGIGFGKTYEQNLRLLNVLEEFHMFGYPVLLGASRKSVIGDTLQLPVDERLEGTIATSVVAAMKGCSFVRVHDVKANVRALKMTEAILHAGK
ncbi:dihydropteroate synthase [Lachnospiraceae bacterium JLR.KK008]